MIYVARELRSLVGYFALSLLLIGVAELAVAAFDIPRLWALMAAFILGYAIVAAVKWRSHTEPTPPSNVDQPDAQSTSSPGSEVDARDARGR